ncbi:hypothetical protein WR25_24302 [Diploscapter pachys]|uniref:Uncharacterized protein n=1 Tax=Diploscapter pachys TaxID=2018661 RepID=A0A2A2LR95_9BILA|nr:hypothetical protein WR25_24302 [Diploscapter pachys]
MGEREANCRGIDRQAERSGRNAIFPTHATKSRRKKNRSTLGQRGRKEGKEGSLHLQQQPPKQRQAEDRRPQSVLSPSHILIPSEYGNLNLSARISNLPKDRESCGVSNCVSDKNINSSIDSIDSSSSSSRYPSSPDCSTSPFTAADNQSMSSYSAATVWQQAAASAIANQTPLPNNIQALIQLQQQQLLSSLATMSDSGAKGGASSLTPFNPSFQLPNTTSNAMLPSVSGPVSIASSSLALKRARISPPTNEKSDDAANRNTHRQGIYCEREERGMRQLTVCRTAQLRYGHAARKQPRPSSRLFPLLLPDWLCSLPTTFIVKERI